tara:strand:+ start:1212 stop:1574 length:363 start_codon:yes stop_codon:yes gene_type:complete
MDNNYADLIKNNSNYEKRRADKYKVDSKERLSKILKKKIETTMIGALSSIEDHFGFLWDSNNDSDPTEEQVIMNDLYQQIRSEILDKGNSQARNIDAELSQYEVEWTKYSMDIPVVTKEK